MARGKDGFEEETQSQYVMHEYHQIQNARRTVVSQVQKRTELLCSEEDTGVAFSLSHFLQCYCVIIFLERRRLLP